MTIKRLAGTTGARGTHGLEHTHLTWSVLIHACMHARSTRGASVCVWRAVLRYAVRHTHRGFAL